MPEAVVELDFLSPEVVTDEDVAEAMACQHEAQAVVDAVKANIERNGNSIREALQRIAGDEALSKKLAKLEKKRGKALLAGESLKELNAEIMGLRNEIEANKMAVGIAEQDAEVLREYGTSLEATLADVEALLVLITAKASALFCFSKVGELNAKTEELAALVRSYAAAQSRTVCFVGAGGMRRTLAATPGCGIGKYELFLWGKREVMPDYKGGLEGKNNMHKIVVNLP